MKFKPILLLSTIALAVTTLAGFGTTMASTRSFSNAEEAKADSTYVLPTETTIWWKDTGTWTIEPYIRYYCNGGWTDWIAMTAGTKTQGNLWAWYTVPANTSAVIFAHSNGTTVYGNTNHLECWTTDSRGRCNQFTSQSSSSTFEGTWGHYDGLVNNISYDANGGSGSISDHQIWLNNATLNNGSNFTRDGYILDHWDLDSGGTIRSIALGADVSWTNFISYADGANVTLYAQWVSLCNYYFINDYIWSGDLYAYAWSGETKYLGSWPGTKLTLDTAGYEGTSKGLYKISVNPNATYIIFNNNNNSQTDNLELANHNGYAYHLGNPAGWSPAINKITLSNNSATTSGTEYIYEKAGVGIFRDANCTEHMSGTIGTGNPINIPTKTGYTFGGYYSSSDCSGNAYINASGYVTGYIYPNSGSTFLYDDPTLYAKWTANTLTVTYSYNGATGGCSETSKSVTYDSEYGELPSPTKTGYTFDGWYLESTFGTKVTSSTTVTTATDHNLYAKWNGKTTTVTLDKQSGSGGTSSVTPTYGEAMPTITSLPSYDYYGFCGYYDGTNGTGTKYYNADGTSAHIWDKEDSTSTLYAYWVGDIYEITLINNDATTTGTTKIYEKYSDGAYLDPECTTYKMSGTIGTGNPITIPAKTGYTFGGYYNDQNCSDKIFINSQGYGTGYLVYGVGFTADGNLYAKWTADTYTITYNLDGGTNNPNNPASYTIESNTITLLDPTKTGYTFTGWTYEGQTTPTKNVTIAKGSTGNKVYTANWTLGSYTINYLDQGGSTFSGTHSEGYPTTHTYGTATTLGTASKTGYTFGGWYLESDCSGTAVTTLGATEYTAAITLYAKWVADTFTIAFDNGGGTGSMTSVTATYGSALTLPLINNQISKTGYTFGKWTQSYYSGSWTDGQEITAAHINLLYGYCGGKGQTVTLTAEWTANTYTLLGTSTNGTVHFYSDSTCLTEITTPVDYGANVWYKVTPNTGYDAPSSSGTQLTLNDTNYTLSGTTATAKNIPACTAHTYTITFDSDGGSEVSSKSVTYNAVVIDASISSKTGYTFSGWYDGAVKVFNADGSVVKSVAGYTDSDGKWIKADTVELKASWTANTYTLAGTSTNGTVHFYSDSTCKTEITEANYGTKVWYSVTPNTGYTAPANAELDLNDTNYTLSGTTATAKSIPACTAQSYTINYLDQGGSAFSGTHSEGYPTTHTYGTATTLGTATKTGYTFGGWFTDSECTGTAVTTLGATDYTDAITLYAKWTAKSYTITVEYQDCVEPYVGDNYGTYGVTRYVNPRVRITDGYVNNKEVNVTILASDDGGITYSITLREETTINCSQAGSNNIWFGSDFFTMSGTYYSHVKIVCVGQNKLISYNISYTLDGGSVSPENPSTYTVETTTFTLNNPTKTGYTFAGWSGTDISGTSTSVTIAKGSYGDRTYTANWTAITYNITYVLKDGTVAGENPSTYTIETETFTLINPTKAGYTFEGWSGTDISGTSTSVTITKGSYGDRTYTANWENGIYTITLTISSHPGTDQHGITVLYEKYGVGVYLDSACTQKMTGTTNPINPVPTLAEKVFEGYYYGSDKTGWTACITSDGYATGYLVYGTLCTSDFGISVRMVSSLGKVTFTIGDNIKTAFTSTEYNATSGYSSGHHFNMGIAYYYFVEIKDNTSISTYSSIGTRIGETNIYRLGEGYGDDIDVDLGTLNCLRTINISDGTLTLTDDAYIYDNNEHTNSIKSLVVTDGTEQVTIDSSIVSISYQRSGTTSTDITNSGTITYIAGPLATANASATMAVTGSVSATYVIDGAVQNFINTYMHTEVKTTESGTGLCKESGWYSAAKTALGSLKSDNFTNEELVNAFKTYNCYQDYYARYCNWARANGESADVLVNNSNNVISDFFNKENSILIVIIVASISLPALFCVYTFNKKRKQ